MVAVYVYLQTGLGMLGRRFANKSKGATAVEYGIMVAAIAAVIVGIVFLIGQQIAAAFQTVLDELT